MKTDSAITRHQRLQLLRLRCQLERKQLQLHALEIRQACANISALGAAGSKFKRSPFFPLFIGVASSAAVGFLLLRPKSGETFLKTGIKLWGMWQRYSPLIDQVRSRFNSDSDVNQ